MKAILKHGVLAVCGGGAYFVTELLWRGRSHWTMAVLGGVCFVLIGRLNERFRGAMPLLWQGAAGAAIVTALELAAGVVLNLWLKLDIWDYTGLPLNLWGQICLPFSLLWVPLSMGAAVLDDGLRKLLFGEAWPVYRLF